MSDWEELNGCWAGRQRSLPGIIKGLKHTSLISNVSVSWLWQFAGWSNQNCDLDGVGD